MRTRELKPGFFRNEELASLPPYARLLYQGLWCIADRRGRLRDNPKLISADVFPYERVPIEKHLRLLEEHRFIERYEAEGLRLIRIPKFLTHQRPHPNEPESLLPPSDAERYEVEVNQRSTKGAALLQPLVDANPSHSSLPLTVLQSNGLTSFPSEPSAKPALAASPPMAMDFSSDDIQRLLASFPGVNVNARWKDFVLWVSEEEEKRRPRDKLSAFEGFLRKRANQTAAAGR